MEASLPKQARFGAFELNLKAGELRKGTRKILLQEQPFQILVMLLEHRGEVVTRDEIKKRLWPNDTVVEFDHSIHTAIKKLRHALEDSAENPKYIETVARRGYRLLVQVELVDASSVGPQALATELSSPQGRSVAGSLIGKRVSHYRVLDILGGGGMGVVYEAEDLKLGRRVALKFLPEELVNDLAAMERFEREARAASALNHPNICTIYAVEEHKGQPFIAMELLEGQTLRELVSSAPTPAGTRGKKGPLQIETMLNIAVQIAEGLDAAHKKGVIHRDIKPANIFLTTQGQVKILDFGLAKLQESEVLDRQTRGIEEQDPVREWNPTLTLTRVGMTIGTAGYMSPEQIRGEKLDVRTDLFSFGLVLYEMAAGQRAFTGETSLILRNAILNETPTSVRAVNPEIPLKLEGIVNHAMEKDRELRYQSAAEIAVELRRMRLAVPGEAAIPQLQPSRPAIRKRHYRIFIMGSILAVLAGVAAMAYRRVSGSSVFNIDSIAVLPFINASGDVKTDYLSDGITESLIDNLIHVPALKVKSRNSVLRYKGKDVDAQKVGRDLGVSALVSGRVMLRGDSMEVSADLTLVRDNTEIWGQRYSGKSTDIISLQQQIAGDLADKLHPKLSTSEKQQVTKRGTQNPEAYELYIRGRYYWNKRTPTNLQTAISYFNQAIAKDPGYALAYSGLADAYSVLPEFGSRPNEVVPKSNAAARKALALDATLARPHADLGTNEWIYDWDFAGGEAELKKAFALDPNDATAHQWYAEDIGLVGGREEEALAEINRARQLDPLSPTIFAIVGFIHFLARRYDEAIFVCKQVARENPTFALPHRVMAQAYWGKRMYPQVIQEWKTYGQLYGDMNDSDFAAAVEQGFRSAGWKGALLKGIHTREVQRKAGYFSAYQIAFMYADSGDKAKAFQWLRIAYQERDPFMIGLKTEFLLDPMRSDPRFAELMQEMALPQNPRLEF